MRIDVDVILDRPPDEVWERIADISTHPRWMEDAVSVEFLTDQHSGVGTELDCLTRVGPIRTRDRMKVTRWEPGRTMGVEHVGLVRGEGAFTLAPHLLDATRFRWAEELHLPWWMGGPLGGLVAKPIVERIWRKNLANLRAKIQADDL